jgi:hypothetical protein
LCLGLFLLVFHSQHFPPPPPPLTSREDQRPGRQAPVVPPIRAGQNHSTARLEDAHLPSKEENVDALLTMGLVRFCARIPLPHIDKRGVRKCNLPATWSCAQAGWILALWRREHNPHAHTNMRDSVLAD